MQSVEEGTIVAGRFRLIALLGHGGMGCVWHAWDEVLNTDAALKQVNFVHGIGDDARRGILTRARREAQHAARLRHHPNVVATYDVVEHDDAPWMVMEYVKGPSLASVLKTRGPVSPEQAVMIGLAVLDALEATHKSGIVHRDVKPANIILADDGRVLLADFGIARHYTDTSITSSGQFVGSVDYTAPERLESREDTPSVDLFSLGATLYEALEGIPPFRRSTDLATLLAIKTEDAPVPANAGKLAETISHLLLKNPLKRPAVPVVRAMMAATTAVVNSKQPANPIASPAAGITLPNAADTPQLNSQTTRTPYTLRPAAPKRRPASPARRFLIFMVLVPLRLAIEAFRFCAERPRLTSSLTLTVVIISLATYTANSVTTFIGDTKATVFNWLFGPPSLNSLPSPCNALTESDMSSMNLNPGDDVPSEGVESKRACGWISKNQEFVTVEYYRTSENLFTDASSPIPGIPHSDAKMWERPWRDCVMSWGTSFGFIIFQVPTASTAPFPESCAAAEHLAVQARSRLPK
ncbi:serine/threonine-protein kinase [Catenulispora yoronensis]|uniref:serine/threonine-protein kinase n=1 Tax=Catenulispora yoronensis TaxID=450799 RepID=UPI0031E475B1